MHKKYNHISINYKIIKLESVNVHKVSIKMMIQLLNKKINKILNYNP